MSNAEVAGYLFGYLILIILGPLAVIWAWNQLFWAVLEIPYTIGNWFAVIVLGAFLKGRVSIKK